MAVNQKHLERVAAKQILSATRSGRAPSVKANVNRLLRCRQAAMEAAREAARAEGWDLDERLRQNEAMAFAGH